MIDFKRIVSLAVAAILLSAGPVWASDPAATETIEPRIVGGIEVAPGEYPFMAALVWRDVSNAWRGLRCGATMIDAEWFLTAAHCVDSGGPEDFDIVVGRGFLSEDGGERIPVLEVHQHPGWARRTYENDIALVRLTVPATVGEPIYWVTDTLADWFSPGTVATVAGWGRTENEPAGTGFGVQDGLRQVDVPVRTSAECAASVRTGEFFVALMLCAGVPEGGLDSCQGDSGGPLFVSEGDRWRQVGIVSWGYGCADSGAYGFYTRVATYDQWIVATTGLTSCHGAPATLVGSPGADRLVGTEADDVIVGEGGRDTIFGKAGNDIICGGGGNDAIYGGPGDDLIFGDNGDDRLFGNSGDDLIFGQKGSDSIRGGPGADIIHGGPHNDEIYGGGGADLLYGGKGDDTLFGNDGNDRLDGGAGADTGYGGKGTDVCIDVECGFTGCETIL